MPGYAIWRIKNSSSSSSSSSPSCVFMSQMTSSGLPELTGSQDLKYVFDALQPHNTDAEATIFFTR